MFVKVSKWLLDCSCKWKETLTLKTQPVNLQAGGNGLHTSTTSTEHQSSSWCSSLVSPIYSLSVHLPTPCMSNPIHHNGSPLWSAMPAVHALTSFREFFFIFCLCSLLGVLYIILMFISSFFPYKALNTWRFNVLSCNGEGVGFELPELGSNLPTLLITCVL